MRTLALWVVPLVAAALAPPAGSLPWIQDDYPQALAEARRRTLPMLVEVWAPW